MGYRSLPKDSIGEGDRGGLYLFYLQGRLLERVPTAHISGSLGSGVAPSGSKPLVYPFSAFASGVRLVSS